MRRKFGEESMTNILSFCYENRNPDSTLEKVDFNGPVNSLDEASRMIPAGAYTTLRTYGKTSALYLDEHFDRLEGSASLAGYPLLLNRDLLRRQIRAALNYFPGTEARVRLTFPFGQGADLLYIMLDALTVPGTALRENGAAVMSETMQRTNPLAKLSSFITESDRVRQFLKDGFEEVIMVDSQKKILEGLTSNFFAVIDGVIFTAEDGALSGITRQLVLAVAADAKILIRLQPADLSNQSSFDEAFITSSSRGVLPVTKINQQFLGSGKPGPLTRKLMQLYDQRVQQLIQPI